MTTPALLLPRSAPIAGSGQLVAGPGVYLGYRFFAADPIALAVVRIRDGSISGPVLDVVNVGGVDPVVATDAGPQAFNTGLFCEVVSGTVTGGVNYLTPRDNQPRAVGTTPLFTASGLLVPTAGTLMGLRLAATAGAVGPSAVVKFRDETITGTVLTSVTLHARQSQRADDLRIRFSTGLFAEVVSGSCEGVATFINDRDLGLVASASSRKTPS